MRERWNHSVNNFRKEVNVKIAMEDRKGNNIAECQRWTAINKRREADEMENLLLYSAQTDCVRYILYALVDRAHVYSGWIWWEKDIIKTIMKFPAERNSCMFSKNKGSMSRKLLWVTNMRTELWGIERYKVSSAPFRNKHFVASVLELYYSCWESCSLEYLEYSGV